MKITKTISGTDVDVLLASGILLTILLILDVWFACAMDKQWGPAFFVQGMVFFVAGCMCFAARFFPD